MEGKKYLNEELFLTPLYKKIEIDKEDSYLELFPYNNFKLELYCPICKYRRIFTFINYSSIMAIGNNRIPYLSSENIKGVIEKNKFFHFSGEDEKSHDLRIYFRSIDENHIEKIGQYPSIYDMNQEINDKKFLKMLDEEYIDYYKTACSLYSFNTCIGAMTYLRRIFEKILIDTFEENKDNLKMTLDEYQLLRMEDKVKNLKEYLPSIMYESGFNKIYSKISDGIHNLTEEECSNIFIVLKNGIEEILQSKMEQKEKRERQKKLGTLLSKI